MEFLSGFAKVVFGKSFRQKMKVWVTVKLESSNILKLERISQEGLSGGLETSAGQAHGAGQHQLTGLLLQRGLLVLLMFCIPISVLWLYSPAVLLFWGQVQPRAKLN